MSKVYVPICGPSETKRAISRAVDYARELNLEVVAINVLDQESIAKLQRFKIFIEEESSMFADSMKKDAEKYLNYAHKVGIEHGVRVTPVLLEGDPFTEIYEHIRNDSENDVAFVCVARKKDGETLKETFGPLERKLILKTKFDIIVAGAEE